MLISSGISSFVRTSSGLAFFAASWSDQKGNVLTCQKKHSPRRKRPPALDFDSLWSRVRKKQRPGRSQELGSLVDLVNGLQTTKAKAAKKHINERIGPWSRRYQFKKPQHYDEGIAEFRSIGGGGSCGVGVTLEFAKAIVKELSQT